MFKKPNSKRPKSIKPNRNPTEKSLSPIKQKACGDESPRCLSAFNLLEGSLAYAIKQAQVRCYEILFDFYGPDTLTPGRMTALCFIGTQPGINQSTLASMLHINRASVVKVVDNLQALGLIKREQVHHDKRSHALIATDKGYAKLEHLTALTKEYERIIATNLTSAERELLFQLLAKVAINQV